MMDWLGFCSSFAAGPPAWARNLIFIESESLQSIFLLMILLQILKSVYLKHELIRNHLMVGEHMPKLLVRI